MGFVLLAKGAGKIFMITEFLSDTTTFVLNIVAYMFWGLEGIGVAYLMSFLLYGAGMWFLCYIYYDLRFERSLYKTVVITLLISVPVFLLCRYGISQGSVWIAASITLVSFIYSIFQLKKKLDY